MIARQSGMSPICMIVGVVYSHVNSASLSLLWVWACAFLFCFSSRRRHTRLQGDWSSDVCSSDLGGLLLLGFGRCGRRGGKGKGDNQDVSERFHGNLREVAVATAASIPSATGPAVPSQTRYAPAARGVRIHSTIALTTRSRAGSNAIPSSFSPDARACPPPPR